MRQRPSWAGRILNKISAALFGFEPNSVVIFLESFLFVAFSLARAGDEPDTEKSQRASGDKFCSLFT